MRDKVTETVEAIIPGVDVRRFFIISVGGATFFFGFAAGAVYNLYLIWTNSPIAFTLRTSLTYKSAIFGDGIVLPIINMIAAAFLLRYAGLAGKRTRNMALTLGIFVTAYFHIAQAVTGLVNWAMPSPWHWNALGAWHAAYMFSVASFLSCFYLVLFKVVKRHKRIPTEAALVTFGLVIFFILLRLDYVAVSLPTLFPGF